MEQKSNKSKQNSSFSKQNNLINKKTNNIHIKYNLYKNLPYFSYKILEAKHSTTPELYEQILLNNLIVRKKNHLFAYLNEIQINTNIFKELLKRFYTYNESKERIPKYVSYYQNYLKFFCRPIFGDYIANKKMVKHMEKVAQIFYNENYAEEDESDYSKKHQKFNFKVFNKTIREEIDNYDNYTSANNDIENENYFEQNNIYVENKKFKTIEIDKKLFCKKNNLELLEKIYKITPIFDDSNKTKKYKKIKNNNNNTKDLDNSKNSEYNSFQKIIKEIGNKKNNKKSKENTHKKNNNKISSHTSSIFDYFNSLSNILFTKKKKSYLHKNNSVSNKLYKKKDKYNYNSNNNKIINNINININHLTIGQRSINPISEINNIQNNNCMYKKYKKRNLKTKKNNSMILKDKSFKNYINCFGNLTSKNVEQKKRNNSFKYLHQGNSNKGYNSNNNKYKKKSNINYNSNVNNTRNKSNLKGRLGHINNGCITSLHKYNNKRKEISKSRPNKMTIFTNNSNSNSNYIKNMHNIFDINNNSKKIKHSNYNSNSIIFSNNNKNSSLSLSPLGRSINHKNKNNISLNKGNFIINYERFRSTSASNKSKKNNKIFSSGFNFNVGIKNIGNNSHNFITPKNNIINKNLYKNEKNNEIKNINSPIYHENIPVINRHNSFLNKKKLKEEQILSYSKAINLKFKNLAKYTNLKKTFKNIPKKSRNKSKSKGKNNNKKINK